MTRAMGARLLKQVAEAQTGPAEQEGLTTRELEVLQLVARGARNVQIAQELFISVNTVKTHLKHILEKLRMENRTQAATYAVQAGLVSPMADKPS